jgi:hypothetical protein
MLKAFPDGLTVTELAKHTGIARGHVVTGTRAMSDIYIDRWVLAGRPKTVKGVSMPVYLPVYVAVEIPQDCPAPE